MQNRIKKITKLIGEEEIKLTDSIDLIMCRSIDISECESVCLALGPRGNLTTLTAATLFLHPNCQVLNHAGTRIFGNKQIDFLSDYSEERFKRFIQFAIKISTKGYRGDRGGTITVSHAFDSKYQTKEIYQKTGESLVKEHIKCLFWKESHRTSNLIREKHVDLDNIFQKNNKLRFLLPIRNPMDCAISNLHTGHVTMFDGLTRNSSVIEVTRAILEEIYWFAELKERFPSRFFYYFEHDISRRMLVDLATFLQLDPNEVWLSNALSVMKIKPSYEHNHELLTFYQEYGANRFSHFPALLEGLSLFS
ncbi:MAG: hypothetical protein WCE68_04700 [Anaerolineales bacterium]